MNSSTVEIPLISVIFSLGNVLIYLSRLVSNTLLFGLFYGLTFGIINPFIIMCVCYASTYSLKLGKILLNSFVLYVKNFPLMLLFSIFTIFYYLLNLIPIPVVMYASKISVIVFVFPIFILAVYLIITKIFDRTINRISHPELVNKGLFIKEDNLND